MENRRNYYRVLHVQPDAPAEVIKATYRTLMQKLKMHPDLGGDTWNAALVNEAYAVLKDPELRKDYDQIILKTLRQRVPHKAAQDVPDTQFKRGHCLFCKTTFLIVPGQAPNDSCQECHSPLQGMDSHETQIALKRMAVRIEKTFDIAYYTYWPQSPHYANAKDFSPTGIAIVGTDDFYIGQLIKIESSMLRAVAQVRNCEAVRESANQVKTGLRFVTASFNMPPGTFVAVTA